MRKKILILGITSFIGFNLSLKLNKHAYDVEGITTGKNNNKKKNNKLKILKENNINFYKKDLLKKNSYEYLKPYDVIVNCIGWTKNYNNSNFDSKNISKKYRIFFNLMEGFLIKNDIDLFIEMGSSSEYGFGKKKFTEKSKCSPVTKYGILKKKNSQLIKKLSKKINTKFIVLRVFSLFGYMNDENKLIEYIKHNLKLKINNTSILLDFTSINYLIELISIILKKKYQNNFEIYNCCSGIALTPIEIINLLPKKRLKKINVHQIESNDKNINIKNKYCIGSNNKIVRKLKIKKLDINRKIIDYFKSKS